MRHLEINIELSGPPGVGKTLVVNMLKDAIERVLEDDTTCQLTAKVRQSPEYPWEVEFEGDV